MGRSEPRGAEDGTRVLWFHVFQGCFCFFEPFTGRKNSKVFGQRRYMELRCAKHSGGVEGGEEGRVEGSRGEPHRWKNSTHVNVGGQDYTHKNV